MSRQLSPLTLAFTLSLLALVAACDESPTLTGPKESPSAAVAAASSYTAQSFGIAGEADTRATGINAAGQVVGYEFDPDDVFRAYIWKNGVFTHLGSLAGGDTKAFDINDFGQVVGSSRNAAGKMRAFRWRNGSMAGLGTLGGGESVAFGINNDGHVVGQSQLRGNTRRHAFLLKNGVMSDLGTLGGANSAALDINQAGRVVGWSETASGVRHPFLWRNGVMKDLMQPSSTGTGTAYAINAMGVVVGERNNRAFRWESGVFGGLGLPTREASVATAIRGGYIVGGVHGRAFVRVGGEVTLLPMLSNGVASLAYGVNGAGVVVGQTIIDLDPSCPNGGCAEFQLATVWTPE
jgi:probable HAF family extracellular repeat protein